MSLRLIGIFLVMLITTVSISSCDFLNSASEDKKYRHIGDIVFDPAIDDPAFKICHPTYIFQYFNNGSGPEYVGGKIELDNYFFAGYEPIEIFEESGLVRIRFVVNCEGQAGYFRMMSADTSYNEKEFDNRITDQLMHLTKSIDEWPIKVYRDGAGDYYMYLIFKISNGQLVEIMP